jgi:2-amino-4-hydroxy-6-hydroxymethyldihydropteridine diphosphokinase
VAVLVVIGLGGNLGDPCRSFAVAARALHSRARVVAQSSLWRTVPLGPAQPDYLNAALLVAWPGHPLGLLAFCLQLEADAGRNRALETRWGPRPLDLDLLVARDTVVEAPALTLPHARFHERLFALLPAAELVPEWVHPRRHRTCAGLAAMLDSSQQPCVRAGELPVAP